MDYWISDRRVYVAGDGTVVEASDPRAARLLTTPGKRMPLAEAIRLGLAESPEAAQEAPHVAPDANGDEDAKALAATADKADMAAEDKGGLTIKRTRKRGK